MSLKDITTEDLVVRWDMIIDDYLAQAKDIRARIIKIEKARNELSLIREELLSRNIEVDKPREVEEAKNVG